MTEKKIRSLDYGVYIRDLDVELFDSFRLVIFRTTIVRASTTLYIV